MGENRKIAREMANEYIQRNDPLGWFEALYHVAGGETGIIPWADMIPNPNFVPWLDARQGFGEGKRALKIGCGLGDDAEEMVRRGFEVTAFDISETAVNWCKARFPRSNVTYVVQDLFEAPLAWDGAYDFVMESYTLQVLPPELRPRAIERIAKFVAPGGTELVICRGRDPGEDPGLMPWPLEKKELALFKTNGLLEIAFEDFLDTEDPPTRRFRVAYQSPE